MGIWDVRLVGIYMGYLNWTLEFGMGGGLEQGDIRDGRLIWMSLTLEFRMGGGLAQGYQVDWEFGMG